MTEPFPITSAAYVERLRKSMKTGGIIVIESFGATAGTPGIPATAIDPEQLLGAFRDFRLLHFEDTMAILIGVLEGTGAWFVWWRKSGCNLLREA